jgi:outer membrane protein assembly factor BamB
VIIEKDGNLIVAQTQTGGFSALNRTDGRVVYNASVHEHDQGVPAVVDSQNIIATSNLIVAGTFSSFGYHDLEIFRPNSGNLVWGTFVSGVLYLASFENVVYVVLPSEVQAYDMSSGNAPPTLWDTKFPSSASVSSMPTIGGGILLVSLGNNSVKALDISTGRTVWSLVTDSQVREAPAFSEGQFFFSTLHGTLYAISALDGKSSWSNRISLALTGSSPIISTGLLYAGASNGTMVALDIATGSVVWKTASLGASITSSPVIASNSLVYVTADSTLYALNSNDGSKSWSYSLDSTSKELLLYKGDLFVSTSSGLIYAFGFLPTLSASSSVSSSSLVTSSRTASISSSSSGSTSLATTTSQNLATITSPAIPSNLGISQSFSLSSALTSAPGATTSGGQLDISTLVALSGVVAVVAFGFLGMRQREISRIEVYFQPDGNLAIRNHSSDVAVIRKVSLTDEHGREIKTNQTFPQELEKERLP